MLKEKRMLAVILFCVVFVTFPFPGNGADNMFVCDLQCNKIGPKPAETEATGSAVFLLDESGQELSYKLMVEKIHDAYMAHLHIGPADSQGQMAAWLYPVGDHKPENRVQEGQFSGVLAEGVIRPADLEGEVTFEEVADSLRNGNAYVNVHTEKYVMGEISGQIHAEEFADHMDRMAPAAGPAK